MNSKRLYETTFIVNAALEDQDIDSVVSKVCAYIENHGGVISETNKWGRRRLAYPINKKYNGYYVHLVYTTLPASVPIFERFMVLEDTILRHLTLDYPENLKNFRANRAVTMGEGGRMVPVVPPTVADLEKNKQRGNRDNRENRDNKENKVAETTVA